MYASDYATAPWGGTYYTPATRNWGFSSIFGAGIYPPGTPILRTFRRTGFRILSEAQFNAFATNTWYGNNTTQVMFPNWPGNQ